MTYSAQTHTFSVVVTREGEQEKEMPQFPAYFLFECGTIDGLTRPEQPLQRQILVLQTNLQASFHPRSPFKICHPIPLPSLLMYIPIFTCIKGVHAETGITELANIWPHIHFLFCISKRSCGRYTDLEPLL